MSNNLRPEIFIDENTFKKYRQSCFRFTDAFEAQLKELFVIKNPKYIGVPGNQAFTSESFDRFVKENSSNFCYVYFPWNGNLIKTIEKEAYLTLKTNRNQDLITATEQQNLSDLTVAILGLSVGSNIAITLTQAGISNKILLADFDTLDTTNLNRILAGVHQIGQRKIEIISQKIYEDNPFAEIIPLSEGVTTKNIVPYLEKKELFCVIDEIDDIGLKISLRLLAYRHKIPVLMITDNGDGIVAHVERYDLGHNKIFGKPLDEWRGAKLKDLSKEEAGGIIINNIVGGPQNVDKKMMASVKRVLNKELVSWTQLGSAALLGGVVATYYVKQIALGNIKQKDIRVFVDPTKFVLETH